MRIFPFFAVLLSSVGFAPQVLAAGDYEKPYVGEIKEIRAKYEDTFVHLARDYNLGYIEMRAANPYVDPWVPGAGTQLILPTRHLLPDAPRDGVVINLPEMRLYYFPPGGEQPVTYPIGVGREGLSTPTGSTKVARKLEGPTWRPTPRMRKEDPTLPVAVPPGPDNPMGTHALYLGWPEYAIHGTNKPYGIGRRVSSGCIRMYPEDIISVFGKVPVGAKVTVVDQPLKMAWIDNRLYLEANTTLEQSIQMEEMGEVEAGKMTEDDEAYIKKFAGEWEDKLRWAAIRTAMKERKGYPVEIARRSMSVVEEPTTEGAAESEVEKTAAKEEPSSGEEVPEETVEQSTVEAAEEPAEEELSDAGAEAIEPVNVKPGHKSMILNQ